MAYSLRQTGTKYPIILFCTNDLSVKTRKELLNPKLFFDDVIIVNPIANPAKQSDMLREYFVRRTPFQSYFTLRQ
jgi:hypothetical protein